MTDSILHPPCALCMGPKCYAVQCIFNGEENPFPETGDAAYCQHAGGGPSHGHRQRVMITRLVPEISWWTDRHTDRQTYSSQ